MSAEPAAEQMTRYHQVRRHAEAAYPAVFTPRKTAPVPLAIGVGDRLFPELAERFGERSARLFLMAWTMRPEYRWAVLRGTHRHELDGTVSGPITEGAREHARAFLLQRYAALYAKRKTRVEEVGDPAKRYPELATDEPLRLLVIEGARELIRSRARPRKRGGRHDA